MISRIEELALIARCVTTDDHRAFGKLVNEYSPGLRRFLFNLTLGDASLTDDVAQDTFIKAYTGLRQFKGMSSFKTWLYRIACHEYHTAVRRRHEVPLSDVPSAGYADWLNRTDDTAPASDRRHDVRVALTRLSEVERTLILLFYFDDLPLRKVASITGLPEGTVKSYLSRARAKMAKTLEQ
ncbi:MAG: RNA polymerase sigma factor [Muribaculaceae bacterium]|nr:RNA polymerase sigma factor [Muribaculaceae bacterium]